MKKFYRVFKDGSQYYTIEYLSVFGNWKNVRFADLGGEATSSRLARFPSFKLVCKYLVETKGWNSKKTVTVFESKEVPIEL